MSIGGWKRAQCIWRNVFGENAFFEYILRTCWTPCRLTNVFITFRECSFFRGREKHWRKVTILDARCTGARREHRKRSAKTLSESTPRRHTHTPEPSQTLTKSFPRRSPFKAAANCWIKKPGTSFGLQMVSHNKKKWPTIRQVFVCWRSENGRLNWFGFLHTRTVPEWTVPERYRTRAVFD